MDRELHVDGARHIPMRRAVILIVLAFAGLMLPVPARASDVPCSCHFDETQIWEYVDAATAIFVGAVTAERQLGADAEAWTLDVAAVYRGAPADSVEVRVTDDDDRLAFSDCGNGVRRQNGEPIVIFGRERDGQLEIDVCDPWLTPTEFDELIEPIDAQEGDGSAWAIAIGQRGNANVQLLDGTGRTVAARRVTGRALDAVLCGASRQVVVQVSEVDDTTSAVFLDLDGLAEVERVPFHVADGLHSVLPAGCAYVVLNSDDVRLIGIGMAWQRADGSEWPSQRLPRVDAAVPGSGGTILATTAGIAFLDDDAGHIELRQTDARHDVRVLIGLAAPFGVTDTVVPEALSEVDDVRLDDAVAYVVDEPTFTPRSRTVSSTVAWRRIALVFLAVAGGAGWLVRRRRSDETLPTAV